MKTNWLAGCFICALFTGTLSLSAGGGMTNKLTALQPGDVRVGGEIGRRILVTITNNLLVLNVDKDFLEPFRKRDRTEGYIGLGKLIDSVVWMAAHTHDNRLIELKRRLTGAIIQTQEPDGYIGLMKPESRMWVLWDVHEMSYLVLALCDDYRFFREKASLEAAQKLADYIIERWAKEPQREAGGGFITGYMAATGVENAMLALHSQTQEERYLNFVVRQRRLAEWPARIVQGRHGQIEGHVYAYICRCLAQNRLYDLQPDEKLFAPSQQAIDFMTRFDGMTISGAVGDHECWLDTQEGGINLGETCATAYLLRFWDAQLRRSGMAYYGDVMERTIYNALFAAQSPDGRRLRYYTPFECQRQYFPGDTYCCPCNYRRIIAELPTMIYYRYFDGLAVNLYTPSEASIALADGVTVAVKQETDYPNSGRVMLTINPSRTAAFPLYLRIPSWCRKAVVNLNGRPAKSQPSGGGFYVMRGEWKPGDKIELTMEMPLRFIKGRKAQSGRVAIMRGPMVFGMNRVKNPVLAKVDWRQVVIDPSTASGPAADNSVRADGLSVQVKAWKPGAWYPSARHDYTLTLTEFADPGCEAVYFRVPNPYDNSLVDDELLR